MESQKEKKMVIYTSPNNDEYTQYWHRNNVEYNFKDKLYIINGQHENITFEMIKSKVEALQEGTKEIFVLWHAGCEIAPGKYKTSNGTEFFLFTYTTQDVLLIENFWSYIGGQQWVILENKPLSKPLDQLCWIINQVEESHVSEGEMEDVKNAIEDVVEYFQKQKDEKTKLNVVLEFLHQSLGGPPPADKKILTENNFNIDGVFTNDDVNKNIGELIDDCSLYPGDYNKILANVRDALLKQASPGE